MTRDYARPNRSKARPRNSRVKPSRKSTPGWIWMIAGILIGALAMAVFRFGPDTADAPAQVETAETAPEKAPQADPSAPKPRFDFYTLLKETEVIVPEQDGVEPVKTVEVTAMPELESDAPTTGEEAAPAVTASAEKPQPGQPGTTPEVASPDEDAAAAGSPAEYQTVYVLQAGSFKQAADADSVRARLLLLNLQASIEKVTTNNNETWHRVLIGPFQNQSESSEVRAILSRNGIDSIQLKRRL